MRGGSCCRPSRGEGRGLCGWLSLPPRWGWARALSRLVRAGTARWPVAPSTRWPSAQLTFVGLLLNPLALGSAHFRWPVAPHFGHGRTHSRGPSARLVGHRLNTCRCQALVSRGILRALRPFSGSASIVVSGPPRQIRLSVLFHASHPIGLVACELYPFGLRVSRSARSGSTSFSFAHASCPFGLMAHALCPVGLHISRFHAPLPFGLRALSRLTPARARGLCTVSGRTYWDPPRFLSPTKRGLVHGAL